MHTRRSSKSVEVINAAEDSSVTDSLWRGGCCNGRGKRPLGCSIVQYTFILNLNLGPRVTAVEWSVMCTPIMHSTRSKLMPKWHFFLYF